MECPGFSSWVSAWKRKIWQGIPCKREENQVHGSNEAAVQRGASEISPGKASSSRNRNPDPFEVLMFKIFKTAFSSLFSLSFSSFFSFFSSYLLLMTFKYFYLWQPSI